MAGRPAQPLFQAQYRQNPSRCHRTIVTGCNAIRFSGQLFTDREKATQNIRSIAVGRARFTERFNITTCCLRARFSRASTRCDFIDEKSDATTARITANFIASLLKPAGTEVNEFNAIEFFFFWGGGAVHGQCNKVFRPGRHLLRAKNYRE